MLKAEYTLGTNRNQEVTGSLHALLWPHFRPPFYGDPHLSQQKEIVHGKRRSKAHGKNERAWGGSSLLVLH